MTFEEKVWEYATSHPLTVNDPNNSYRFINIRGIERFTTPNGDFFYVVMLNVVKEQGGDTNKPTIVSFHLIENDKGEVFEGPSIHICGEWSPPQEVDS